MKRKEGKEKEELYMLKVDSHFIKIIIIREERAKKSLFNTL